MGVRTKASHVAKPAEPTWNGILPLSELDQVGMVRHTLFLYVYKSPTTRSQQDNKIIFEKLKDSLSLVLVPFYPLAGRLHWLDGGRLELKCNAIGAELIEAESHWKISDFGDFSHHDSMLQQLVPVADFVKQPFHEIPLLLVQVTQFQCGGFSLGIAASHVIVDAKAAFHFTDEWARLTRGESLGVLPYVDRGILQPPFNHKAIIPKEILQTLTHPSKLIIKEVESNYVLEELSEKKNKLSAAKLLLTKTQIDMLKKVANANRDDGVRPYTRFEVIATHIWRCVSKARHLISEQPTDLLTIVNSRGRMDPPLPSSYFGNAIVAVPTSSQASELISKPLSDCCRKIREAIELVNNEYVWSMIDYLKRQESLCPFQDLQGFSLENPNVEIISWLNLSARDKDFGWGKEIYFGLGKHLWDAEFLILPEFDDNNGSVLVDGCLQADHMDEFKIYFYEDIKLFD